MFAGIRSYAQSLATGAMDQTCVIRHKADFQFDPENPKGDDDLDFEPTTTTAKCWLVSNLTKSVSEDGALTSVAETNTIRLPVGTRVGTGDELTVEGNVWTVVDTSSDEGYPAMLKVSVQRQS